MLPERLQDYNIKYESKKKFKAIKSAYMFFLHSSNEKSYLVSI